MRLGPSLALAAAGIALVVGAATLRSRAPETPSRPDETHILSLTIDSTPAELEAARDALFAEMNAAREREGRPPLAKSAALERAASAHAADMAARGYIGHESPEGETPGDRVDDAGYGAIRAVGETLAFGQREARAVVDGWLRSPPHRAILLDGRLVDVGCGVAVGRDGRGARIAWAALYATPAETR